MNGRTRAHRDVGHVTILLLYQMLKRRTKTWADPVSQEVDRSTPEDIDNLLHSNQKLAGEVQKLRQNAVRTSATKQLYIYLYTTSTSPSLPRDGFYCRTHYQSPSN